MNKIFLILTATTLLIVTSGCTDWLEVRPESEIVLEDYWQNESHVNQVLAACYRSMTEYSYMDRMLIWEELRSDNVTFGNNMSTAMYKMLNVDISTDNVLVHWGSFYNVINICNNFLHFAPRVAKIDPNFTESKLYAMEAEVLTIRALSYFYLVRTFNDVPWIGDPSIDDTQNYTIPKSPGDSILNLLVSDLSTALLYVRDNYETNAHTKGRVTRNAVRALLADIYLWQEEYQKCVEVCNQIIDSEEYQLVDGKKVLVEVFYEGNSTESIFELQFDNDNMFNWVLRDFYGLYGNQSGQWSFPSIFVTGQASPFSFQVSSGIESEEDLREKDFLRKEAGGDRYFVFKYAGALRQENATTGASSYVYRNNTANWIMYRLPDIYLMKAEALIQLESNSQEAIDMINMTYVRANPELVDGDLRIEDYNSKIDLENLLLRERQRELMFEGKRWFDLMRLARRENSPIPLLNRVMRKYTGTATIQATKMSVMNALYLPIHEDELKANSALEQNPFYEITSEGK